MHKIQDCGSERCISPIWSPNAAEIAYTKESPAFPSSASLWIFDIDKNQSTMITEENQNTAFAPIGRRMVIGLLLARDRSWYSHYQTLKVEKKYPGINPGRHRLLVADNSTFYYSDMTFIQAAFHHVIREIDLTIIQSKRSSATTTAAG